MKITIEPTEPNEHMDEGFPTVAISIKGDDWNLDSVKDRLIIPALAAFGYSQTEIAKVIGGDE